MFIKGCKFEDGMNADILHLKFIDNISNKIINNVKGINREVYDIYIPLAN